MARTLSFEDAQFEGEYFDGLVKRAEATGAAAGGLVFVYDDADITQYTQAYLLCHSPLAAPMCLAVPTNYIARPSDIGPDGRTYMTWAQIRTIANDPVMEVHSHSMNHLEAATYSEADYETEVLAAEAQFAANNCPFTKAMTYPLYSYNAGTMRVLRSLGYIMGYVGGRSGGSPGAVNPRPIEPQRVYRHTITTTAGQLTGFGTSLPQLQRLMDDALARGDLLVLCVHATPATPYAGQEALVPNNGKDLIYEAIEYAQSIGLEIMDSTRAAEVFANTIEAPEEEGLSLAVAASGQIRQAQTRMPHQSGYRRRNAIGDIREDVDEHGRSFTGHVLGINSRLRGEGTTALGWTTSGLTNLATSEDGTATFDVPVTTAAVIYQNVEIPPELRGRWVDILVSATPGAASRMRVMTVQYVTISPSVAIADSTRVSAYLGAAPTEPFVVTVPVDETAGFVQVQIRVESGAALVGVEVEQAVIYAGQYPVASPDAALTGAGGTVFGVLEWVNGALMKIYSGTLSLFGHGSVGSRVVNVYDTLFAGTRVWAGGYMRITDRTVKVALNPGEFTSVNGVMIARNKDGTTTPAGLVRLDNVAVALGNNPIAHGLGHTPTIVTFAARSAGLTLYEYMTADATNIYINSSAAGTVKLQYG